MARELFKFRLFGKLIVFEYVGTARPGEPGYDIVQQPPIVEEPLQTGLYMPIPLSQLHVPESSQAPMPPPLEYQEQAKIGAEAVVEEQPAGTPAYPVDELPETRSAYTAGEATPEHPGPPASSTTIEERLLQLTNLRDKRLITSTEYDQQRIKILSEL